MAYIGAEPLPGQNREVDDISSGFNGSATSFTLQVSSTNVSPESANNILVNLGGVIQNPGTDYTIAASTITFTTAPAAGLSFFGLILGAGINTATVADQTIGTSKVLDNAITADKLAHTSVTAGSYTTADITVDAQGRITAAANGTISGAEIADQAVTNAKVNNSAAIAGTKISPDFGSQNIVTTGSISGAAGTFTGDLTIPDKIVHTGDTDTAIRLGVDTVTVETAGSERARVTSGGLFLLGTNAARAVGGTASRKFQIEGVDASSSISITRNSNNTSSGFLSFGKSRSASAGGSTIVQSGDILGTISFAGADGTNLESRAADIQAAVDATPGENDMPGRLMFKTTPDGSVSPAERMRIDSVGLVGIGETSMGSYDPGARTLVLSQGGTLAGMTIRASSQGAIYFADGTSGTAAYSGRIEYTHSDNLLRFGAGGNGNQVNINNAGALMIGSTTQNDDELLTILETGTNNEIANFRVNDGGHAKDMINMIHVANSGTKVMIRFRRSGSLSSIGDISTTPSSTSYGTSSDYRLKENITSISDGITRLKTLKPYRFNFKVEPSKTVDGFLAHEVTAVPEAIIGVKDAVETTYYKNNDTIPEGKAVGDVKEENAIVPQSLDYAKLTPLLTAALQEAITKIETLETKVAALEAA